MKVAALSPKETAKLKKDLKDDYVGKLVEFIAKLGPRIASMAESSFQIRQMADAKRAASESLAKAKTPAPKAKRGKGKTKRSGSAASLPGSV